MIPHNSLSLTLAMTLTLALVVTMGGHVQEAIWRGEEIIPPSSTPSMLPVRGARHRSIAGRLLPFTSTHGTQWSRIRVIRERMHLPLTMSLTLTCSWRVATRPLHTTLHPPSRDELMHMGPPSKAVKVLGLSGVLVGGRRRHAAWCGKTHSQGQRGESWTDKKDMTGKTRQETGEEATVNAISNT